MSDRWAADAEAYVLGALDQSEREAFERHLRACPGCRAAVEEVGRLPALLDQVPHDVVARLAAQDPVTAAVTPPPETHQVPGSVLATLLREARTDALRARRRVLVAAVAVAAVVTLALVVPASPLALVDGAAPAPGQVVALQPEQTSPVTASVVLSEAAWGTRIEVSCSYAAVGDAADGGPGGYDGGYDGGNDPGAPTDAVYGLVVRGDDGGSEQVASWTGVPGHEITVPAASRRRMAEIASISLVGADGQVLLTAEL